MQCTKYGWGWWEYHQFFRYFVNYCWTIQSFDLTMVLIEKPIHAKRDMDICNTFPGRPANSCWDISLKTTNINLMVVRKEKPDTHLRIMNFIWNIVRTCRCSAVSQDKWNCWLLVQDEVRGSSKQSSLRFYCWAPWISVPSSVHPHQNKSHICQLCKQIRTANI